MASLMKSSKKPNKLNKEQEIALIDDLLHRSVAEIIPSKESLKEVLLSGKKLKVYIGTDATGASLHLGHAKNYMVLEKFRKLGHKIIFLIGDFTARIGDPTDKDAARKQLTRKEVKQNVATWLKQVAPIINFKDANNPAIIKYNHDWLSKLTFEDIIGLASHFTVQQMLERDMFERRLEDEKPIYLHEFLYPLMQGYDSVAMDVDVELCGNDQKFNALAGRTLQRKINNKEKFVFITTLLVNPITGEKMMSKSLGTGVFLDTSPNDMFGSIMSQSDESIIQLLTDCTYISLEKIEQIKTELKTGIMSYRDAKAYLAKEIVSIYHGDKKADMAEKEFDAVFKDKKAPTEINEIKVAFSAVNITSLLILSKLAESKSDARRLISQGAVKIDGHKIIDFKQEVIITPSAVLLQVGKHKFIKIRKIKT